MRYTVPVLAVVACAALLFVGSLRGVSAEGPKPQQPGAEPQPVCILPAESYHGKTAEQWRAQGPQGLMELMALMQPTIKSYRAATTAGPLGAKQTAVTEQDRADLLLLDQVAQQRDAYAAGLYWYTDLDQAIDQAKRTGRPILSLRMLGELVDEYSCANSRYFRTTLYADESVSKLLREQFVLHWQSVRPVPVITVDMGDGRTIKRTITGNSAHYVLDQHGRVVDCLPGLYGPDTFERFMRIDHALAKSVADKDDSAFARIVASSHQRQANDLDRAWQRYMGVIHAQDEAEKKPIADLQTLTINLNPDRPAMPNAIEAGRLAIAGKMDVERPLVEAVMPNAPTVQEAADDMRLWQRVAEAYQQASRLDEGSKQLMAIKAPKESMQEALNRALSKTLIESPLARMIRNFENGVAVETARNEHLLRRQLHGWFASAKAPLDLDALNKRVYAELFLTPDDDPWLGLVPPDAYSALDAGGLITTDNQNARR